MKKFITLIISAMLVLSFTACSGEPKNPDVNTIMSSIKADIEFPEMSDVALTDIGYYIQINADDVDSMAYSIAGSGITADEVLIVKMKDGINIEDVKTQLEVRKTIQATSFEPYAPDEMPKIDSAVIEVAGQYAIYAVTNDNAKAKKLFKDAV